MDNLDINANSQFFPMLILLFFQTEFSLSNVINIADKYHCDIQGSHSKSYVVGSCIYNSKDEHPCIITIQMVTMNILT